MGAAHGWLSLFRRLETRVSSAQVTAPLSRVKESLKYLNLKGLSGLIIDASFTSPIQLFHNLVDLTIPVLCHPDQGRCTFELNNNNIAGLVVALPRLESLFLGRPCSNNSCTTTVACLLIISVHCTKLQELEIHFNTANVIRDFEDLSEDYQELLSLPRCALRRLNIHRIPLTLDGPGFEAVVNGISSIFPSLELLVGVGQVWNWTAELKKVRAPPVSPQ